jgi:hypothetical protein
LAISVPSLAAEAVPPHTGLPIDADDQNQQKDGRLHRSDPAEQAGQVCGPAVSTWLRPRACTRAVRLPGVDDIAVSAIRFGGNHQRRGDADGLDRCHHNASACGKEFDWRIRSGFSFRTRGSTFMICMEFVLFERVPGRRLAGPSCFHLFSKTLPGPLSGRTAATAAEHPCWAGQAGLPALRRTSGRDCAGGGLATASAGGPGCNGFIHPAFPFQSSLINLSRKSKTIECRRQS